MKETQIHRIWLEELWKVASLKTASGKKLEIISPGIPNPNAGPDFFNAMIRIGEILWAGNVEVHLRASDWFRHGHHLDEAYNNVILHLVVDDDARARNHFGRVIPTLQVPSSSLSQSPVTDNFSVYDTIPCLPDSCKLRHDLWQLWLRILYRERMEEKSRVLLELNRHPGQNWEDTLYLTLGSMFGLPINVLPFRMTLASIPEKVVLQLRDEPANLEALLYGQAGLLPGANIDEPYIKNLKRRFTQLGKELAAPPLEAHLWKFLRLRPASFPTLRISQFAMLAHRHFPILETLLDLDSPGEVESLLKVASTPYWNTHYCFGRSSPGMEKSLGKQARESLVVNAIVPFLKAFGKESGHRKALALGESLMEDSHAESNRITRLWQAGGIRAGNAMESQALIQLYKEYCKQKRCYDCLIGKLIFPRYGP